MTVLYMHSRNLSLDKARRELLSHQFRFNLLGLKEFEQCHMLARWIRKLFLLVRDRSGPMPAALRSPRLNSDPSTQTVPSDMVHGDSNIVSGNITSTSERSPSLSKVPGESDEVIEWNTLWSTTGSGQAIPNCSADMESDSLVTTDVPPLGQSYSDMDFPFDFFTDSELLDDQTMQMFADEWASTADASGWLDLDFSRP